jgi:hypothetical protein
MFAKGNITVNGGIYNSNNSVIYSENGNINIIAENFSYNGLIFAPNGTVRISSGNTAINGTVIAKELIIEGGNTNINVTDLQSTKPFSYYRNNVQDFTVSSSDAEFLYGLTSEEWELADVNGDGFITSADVEILTDALAA